MSYKDVGLKVGMEFHQRLDTHKLFCNCESGYGEEKPKDAVSRKLRPVAGELGEVDPAAILEFSRNKTFVYQLTEKSSDLVELDEEPPHSVNPEALDIVLELSLLLNCDLVDEIHVMRKTVIDGSNTAGFQRTMLVGHSGLLNTPYGKIPITGVYLEEEAAGIVEEKNGMKVYRLDRLGIPLTEISTGIMELEPKEVKDVALRLGTLLRVTGKVQRGIGSIRQDVNVSIKGGERVEIKGVQELHLIDKMIENEVERQQNLIKLKSQILSRGIPELRPKTEDYTKYFTKTTNKIFKGKKVYGVELEDFKGLLGFKLNEGRGFGAELAGIARSFGFGGIIHTDEDLKRYGIEKEVLKIREGHKLSEDDSIIFITETGKSGKAEEAFSQIVARINQARLGIPKETRRALPDGNTEFMRPLPGEARLYPETDIPPVLVTEKRIKEIKPTLPEHPEETLEKLITKYKLSDELANRMLISKYAIDFYDITNKVLFDPNFVANTLLNTLTALRREGFDITKITPQQLKDVFKAVKEKRISRQAVPNVLRKISRKPHEKITSILEEFEAVSENELKSDIDELIEKYEALRKDERKMFRVVMGELMQKYRGKIEGNTIAKLLRKKLGT